MLNFQGKTRLQNTKFSSATVRLLNGWLIILGYRRFFIGLLMERVTSLLMITGNSLFFEDPSANFQITRDFVDCIRCRKLPGFSKEKLKNGYSDDMANESREQFKINKKMRWEPAESEQLVKEFAVQVVLLRPGLLTKFSSPISKKASDKIHHGAYRECGPIGKNAVVIRSRYADTVSVICGSIIKSYQVRGCSGNGIDVRQTKSNCTDRSVFLLLESGRS
ncbi:unnamed protein product [Nesidiocoris tenuis]|uniref:Histone acetyltransferase type B catalytic subunit n=1 Tax=Nesidiocoris tenuis TaxID=355587 RepID=A0A6H5HI49_9HEMI|nr:unnamed protein product [Nesidiocoris tenuis]